jgi:hypothetical protein
MRRAILHARMLGWGFPSAGSSDNVQYEQIADLMDAIHNLPGLMQNWDQCDQNWLRETLKAYDDKRGPDGGQLLRTYDLAVSGTPG